MRKLVIILVLVNSLLATAQTNKVTPEPLIIRGKLSNSPERKLKIGFYDEHGVHSIDTIFLDPDGTFFLKTYRCTHPQRTNIQQNQTQINDIFIAPGYDLVITGDATNFETLFATVKITGKGATSNRYRELKNDWYRNHKPDTSWYERSKRSLVRYAKREKRINDSIAQVVFSGPIPKDDAYVDFFKRSIELDNAFTQLYCLMAHANIYQLSVAESEDLVGKSDSKLPKIDNDAYLISTQYKTWIIGEYLNYLVRLDYLKEPARKGEDLYPLKKSAQVYSGKVRDNSLYRKMSNEVGSCQSLERLHTLGNLFQPYLPYFTDDFYRKSIAEQFTKRADYLLQTSIGKPAPAFTLKNEQGQAYSLANFEGKVVYIDLWASWCKPCREETPFLEAVYNQYKDDSRIAFISIAVADGRQAWLNALKKDKPTWLQLIDSEGKVQAAYNANLIPRFVIINKRGEIVNFNAPQPSHKDELVKLLEKEMAL
ncbi:TlpA family protein disulfide reductase [Fulvivirgaceae bacterium PWU5]|uniref:TlpA family protein disulfide reductase n=1 Tax=Dawidia cretensis TaxID=2782350 RepID=A0AAP2DW22_9BACT|nr:TlpA disulfide reductase family protein [Dawidia cretensis]MBT1708443.1 TlpA family protein disulfide reductase [Dawidia cretensis]